MVNDNNNQDYAWIPALYVSPEMEKIINEFKQSRGEPDDGRVCGVPMRVVNFCTIDSIDSQDDFYKTQG